MNELIHERQVGQSEDNGRPAAGESVVMNRNGTIKLINY